MHVKFLETLDWSILIAYFLILIAIGIWASSKRKKGSSLFLAENSLRWYHIGFSMWGTNVGPSMLIASASAGFTTGIVSGNYAWYAFVFICLLAFVFAPRYLGSRITTLPEFMGKRFGQSTRNILAWYTIITILISWLALTLFAGGVLIRQVFDIPMWQSALLLLVISAFFTMLGGLKAVAYTNVYQMILLIVVSATLAIMGIYKVGGVGKPYFYSIPLYKLDNSELPKLDSPLRFDDVSFTELSNLNECSPFVEALSDIHVDINFRTDYYATSKEGGIKNFFLLIFKKDSSGNVSEVKSYESDGIYKYINEVIPVDLSKGESLIFAIHIYFISIVSNNIDIAFPNFSFGVNFKSKINSVDIDVISPNTILSKLLDSMTENTIDHKGVIDVTLPSSGEITPIEFNRLLERTYIMAAESARGLPKAKIYTSYKKFCEWMEAEFGYVPVINENTVTFMHRDKLFSSTVVKDLGTEINDYEFSVNDSLIYSSVKVGYDKQDYDSINGRDEFRFTNEFSTGLKLTDNTLSLISPYRADAYGIEFLVQKRGEDTTDNDSDNDVFFVECDDSVPVDQPLPLYRPYSESQLSGLLSPDTMFNLNYSPRFMLEANKKYIGACTNLLKFASSDGNSDVSIDGVKETDDFSIPERLFTVSEVEVETSDIISPDDLLGLVSLNNKGEIVTGYIKQLKLNIAKDKSASYSLIVKNIKK